MSRVLLFFFLTLFEFDIAGIGSGYLTYKYILKVTNIIKEQYLKLIKVKKKNFTSNRSSRLEVLQLY